MTPDTILLPHHGTAGAKQAEALAYQLAQAGKTALVHLFIVPDFWAGMQGDDWLNNASTRDDFAHYVEGMLEAEARAQLQAVEANCVAHGISYQPILKFGEPTSCLIAANQAVQPSLLIMGARRRRGMPGYRSHINLEKLLRTLSCPLIIAPQAP